MATVTNGYTFVSGETVTPAKLNDLVSGATVTEIETADISDAQITTAKIANASSTTTGVTNSKLRHSAALSVIGNSTNASGAPADIAAANDGEVLRRSGTAVGFGQVATAGIADSAVSSAKIANASVTASKMDGEQTGSAPVFGCRAWVNFNGNAGSTVDGEFRCTIRASGNVSKVVRTATGVYLITFTTAMPDANYALAGFAANEDSNVSRIVGQTSTFSPTEGACQIRTASSGNGSELNVPFVSVMFIR